MKSRYNVLTAQCPSHKVLEVIADKWTAIVIHVLREGTLRRTDLKQRIGGISDKMLTHTLRKLECDGLVRRKVYPVVPPKVDYSLTALGKTLTEPLSAICRWAESHIAEIEAARRSGGNEVSNKADSGRN
jgi:DNA-binding HxlR family transcriptional regulator